MESPFLQTQGVLRYIGLFLSGICHQLPEHSLFWGGQQVPLCARCTGTYLGALLGFVHVWRKGRIRASKLPPTKLLIIAVMAGILWVVDGLNSYYQFLTGDTGLYPPNSALRILTGMGMGLSLSFVVIPTFNLIAWRDADEQRAINSPRELGTLALQAATLAIVLQSGLAILYWPLFIAETLSVLFMLTVVNGAMVIIFLQRTNQAARWSQITLPLALGLALTLLEVGGIAWVRVWLTYVLPTFIP